MVAAIIGGGYAMQQLQGEKIKKTDVKIKKTKAKVKSTKSAKKTISDFEKKYRK